VLAESRLECFDVLLGDIQHDSHGLQHDTSDRFGCR
jgi:hypothetical protein